MPNFVSFAASTAELAHEEKLHTHSPSLLDALGTEAFASEQLRASLLPVIAAALTIIFIC